MDRRHFVVAAGACIVATRIAAAAPAPPVATIVADLASKTRALYHDGSLAAAIADRLEADFRSGAFQAAGSPMTLATLLNERIARASRDLHFMVMPGEMHAPPVPSTPPHSSIPPFTPDELNYLQERDFGIREAVVLPGNVGRLGVRQFYRPAKEVRDRLGQAMAALSRTAALIVDLAGNPGGDPHAVALLLSYFFEREPFVVNRFLWRDRPVEEFRTTAAPGGPRYGESRPLVVTVTKSSYSAAEEFAYDVQALRRGLVVGEATGGGANHALPVPIAGGFTAFIPQARAENPITRSNWEGKGILPDVKAGAADLAKLAHREALRLVIGSGRKEAASIARAALEAD